MSHFTTNAQNIAHLN